MTKNDDSIVLGAEWGDNAVRVVPQDVSEVVAQGEEETLVLFREGTEMHSRYPEGMRIPGEPKIVTMQLAIAQTVIDPSKLAEIKELMRENRHLLPEDIRKRVKPLEEDAGDDDNSPTLQ